MLIQKCWSKKIFQNLFSPNKFGHKKFGSYNLLVKKKYFDLKTFVPKNIYCPNKFLVHKNFKFKTVLVLELLV